MSTFAFLGVMCSLDSQPASPVITQGKCGWGWQQFLSLPKLLANKSSFSKGNAILVGVQLTFNPCITAGEAIQVDTPQLKCFASLYDEQAFSDIVIKAGTKSMRAHKAVLAAHSPSLKAMFQTDMREMNEGEVSLETTAEVLELLLSFMYGCLEYIATKFLLPLFQISDCHQVLELRGVCVKGMLNNVTIDNLFDYMVAADACSEEQLIQACLTFAVKHSDEVSRAPGMQALMQNQTKLAQELIIAMVDGQSPARKKQKL